MKYSQTPRLLILQDFFRKTIIISVTRFEIIKLFIMCKQCFNFQICVTVCFECCLYCFKKFNDNSFMQFSIVFISHVVLKFHFNFQFTGLYFWISKICLRMASALFFFSINYNFVRTQLNFDTFTHVIGIKRNKKPSHLFQPPI